MKGYLEGYYTVEAAFVMMLGLMAVFTLLYLSFFIHDIQCLQSELNVLADRAVAEEWKKEAILEEAEKKREEIGLMVLRIEKVEVREKEIIAEVIGGTPFFVRYFGQIVPNEGKIKAMLSPFVPEEQLRITAAGREVIN